MNWPALTSQWSQSSDPEYQQMPTTKVKVNKIKVFKKGTIRGSTRGALTVLFASSAIISVLVEFAQVSASR